MTQDEHGSDQNDPGQNKRTVGETDVNEKIGETAGYAAVTIKLIIYCHQNGIEVTGKQKHDKP